MRKFAVLAMILAGALGFSAGCDEAAQLGFDNASSVSAEKDGARALDIPFYIRRR